MIDIKNLNFKYKDKKIFEDFNMHINKGIISIIGPNGSGKSTLVKILTGNNKFSGTIQINKKELNKKNLKGIRKDVAFVFSNPDDYFVSETVMDEIAFSLENLNYDKKEIRKLIENISRYLGIYNLLELNPHKLNNNQKQLVSLACALVYSPKILILDDALGLLDYDVKLKVINMLKEYNKKGLTIINITHDIEETLISDYIYVLDKGKIVLEGSKEEVYEDEKKLYSLGYKLPFMVELSNRMIFYGLIEDVIYDMEEMVNLLWK